MIPLSARLFFVGVKSKAQAILDVLPSILGTADGKIAVESRAEDEVDQIRLIAHIEEVACYKKHRPLTLFGKQEIKEKNYRIKYQKFNRKLFTYNKLQYKYR